MNDRTKKLTTIAMLCAMAYVVMVVIRIPVVLFLKYEAKDVIIAIGGFLFGPLASVAVSVVTSLVEMVTVSDTGLYGLIMNIISSLSFAAVAALIYQRKRSVGGAVLGLIAAIVVQVSVMLLWNYIITPVYMGQPRDAVAKMLVPVFLPFNLLKSSLNATITMLLYKPVVTALRKAGLVPDSQSKGGINIGAFVVSAIALVGLILWMLIWKGII
ncbi:MAG: ECF transporter S component [Oscillospiraceae bacterium]|nr:ECF transporter S component [Oscillospiraceae bacterium]